jgi:CDGSH-type Zn-finger protein
VGVRGRVTIAKDGPYIVSGAIPLAEYRIALDERGDSVGWSKVKDYPVQENYALCRCGGSKNPPFCDGAHVRTGFDGSETAERTPFMESATVAEGPVLDLISNSPLCVGARFCDVGKKAWNLVRSTDDEEDRAQFISECMLCPSGRFVAWDKERGQAIEPVLEPEIGIINDPVCDFGGPIWIRGCIEVESSDGFVYEVRNRVTLCRCGLSENKPFCDASHFRIHIPSTFDREAEHSLER